jgi:hypothetical protein
MALQFSVPVRNAWLNATETEIGASPIMRIRTGAVPANCAAADTGTVLATLALPADWMAAAANGAKALAGLWTDPAADAAGTAAHFRIYDSTGTTCHCQGTVSLTGAGGDMQLGAVALAAGVVLDITAFNLNAGNA